MAGVAQAGGNYSYLNGKTYTSEYVQNMLTLNTARTPIYTWISEAKLSGKAGDHKWSIALQDMFYHIKKYYTESVSYTQSIEDNPDLLVPQGATGYIDGFHAFNSVMEYHRGNMNKVSLIMKDAWTVNTHLDLKAGIRLEYQNLRGRYIPIANRKGGLNGSEAKIGNEWLNRIFSLGATYFRPFTVEFGVGINF